MKRLVTPGDWRATARALARAGAGLACGVVADVGEILVASLLTTGAAAAVLCALASLLTWGVRAILDVPAQWLARRLLAAETPGIAGGGVAMPAGESRPRCHAMSNGHSANGAPRALPGFCRDRGRAVDLPAARASPAGDGERETRDRAGCTAG